MRWTRDRYSTGSQDVALPAVHGSGYAKDAVFDFSREFEAHLVALWYHSKVDSL